eukprot:CAMPEP_0198646412 /NCGR_PEP_ID=MMETSP1467-20131203/1887_1 /TAXON_ID=1462469 /ORGANISM="unid. sp., Strain CCMP2135" /LENGTH=771 /DNA_ID=CAMNT_0044381951 /DNA_START=52 /DNA_END=2367 /DNA_ORIENTATION=+
MSSNARSTTEETLLEYAIARSMATTDIPLEEGWSKIKNHGITVLVGILQGDTERKRPFGNKGYVSLYTISYRMCSNAGVCDHSKELYDLAKSEIHNYLRDHILWNLRQVIVAIDAEDLLLTSFSRHWENHKVFITWIQQLFRHLDNGYVANASVPTITSVGLRLFYDVVFLEVKAHIVEDVVRMINKEREGCTADLRLLRSCIEAFLSMGHCSKSTCLRSVHSLFEIQPDLSVYESEYESILLLRSAEFYAEKSVTWLASKSISSYLVGVEKALEEEAQRVLRYMHASSTQKLLKVCERELLQKKKKVLIEGEQGGLMSLISQGQHDDIHRMFKLFRRIPDGLPPMACVMKRYVHQRGRTILQARPDHSDQVKREAPRLASDLGMIDSLLALQAEMNQIVGVLFSGETRFQQSLREALQDIVNTDALPEMSNAEMLVVYTDRILRGKVRLAEEEIENALDQIVQLFLFLSDKDLFAEYYRVYLANRLLSKKATSIHLEKSMISKLKSYEGAPFTTKLEGMINDFSIGKDLDHMWRCHVHKAMFRELPAVNSVTIDFSVQVLTQGFWPTQKFRELHLTRELSQAKASFDGWYRGQHSHRVLTWIYALGDVIVRGNFPARKYDICVTAFQAVTLVLCSASHVAIGFSDLQDRLGIDQATAKRVLHSLACGRHNILDKTGHQRHINVQSDQFTLNNKFTSKLKRFTIQMASFEKETQNRVDSEVQHQRSFTIDAMYSCENNEGAQEASTSATGWRGHSPSEKFCTRPKTNTNAY